MSVGLRDARNIIHFEDIATEMSLLVHNPHLGYNIWFKPSMIIFIVTKSIAF